MEHLWIVDHEKSAGMSSCCIPSPQYSVAGVRDNIQSSNCLVVVSHVAGDDHVEDDLEVCGTCQDPMNDLWKDSWRAWDSMKLMVEVHAAFGSSNLVRISLVGLIMVDQLRYADWYPCFVDHFAVAANSLEVTKIKKKRGLKDEISNLKSIYYN